VDIQLSEQNVAKCQ